MKKPLLLLAVLTATTLAQSPIPQRVRALNPQNQSPELTEAFAENYLVTLSVTDNDKPVTELVIATARAKFSANTVEPGMTVEGILAPLEDGTVLVTYVFGAEVAVPTSVQQTVTPSGEPGVVRNTSIQYKTQSAQAQVRLKLGESMNVLKTGQRTYRLTVSKLSVSGAKEH
jgi:hypothetical protein